MYVCVGGCVSVCVKHALGSDTHGAAQPRKDDYFVTPHNPRGFGLVFFCGGGTAAAKLWRWIQQCPMHEKCTNAPRKKSNCWCDITEECWRSRQHSRTLAAQPQSNFAEEQPRSCVGRALQQASKVIRKRISLVALSCILAGNKRAPLVTCACRALVLVVSVTGPLQVAADASLEACSAALLPGQADSW